MIYFSYNRSFDRIYSLEDQRKGGVSPKNRKQMGKTCYLKTRNHLLTLRRPEFVKMFLEGEPNVLP